MDTHKYIDNPLLTVVGQPGLHHNFLRYTLDHCSALTPEITQLPFKHTGTSHVELEYSGKFDRIQGRPVHTQDQGPFVLCVADDILYYERASVSREGDRNNDLKQFKNFKNWQPWNNHYVDTITKNYKIEEDKPIPKFILRDSIKQSYLDLKNNGLLLHNNTLVNSVKNTNTDNYFFPVSSFFSQKKFINELSKLDVKYNLSLDLEKVPHVYDSFLERNQILQSHFVVDKILTAIKNRENIEIPELDVFQEGYIYAKLEETNDFIIMPMIEAFYKNTQEINEYLQYYPEHYKAMNPNLPTFNEIPNPFHLWNLKK